ncbi:MAG: S1 family peptidase, partial [Gemmatimonadaceae bacterium]
MGQPHGLPPARPRTTERIAAAVDERTRGLRRAVTALTLILVAALLAAWWVGQRGARTHAEDLLMLSRTNDSLARAYGQRVESLSGRVAGLDSSLATAKVDADAMRHQLADATRPASSDSLERALRALESRRHAMLTAAQVDYASIASHNGAAVVLIAVQWPDGKAFSGSGFCVQSGGTIITNRHLMRRDGNDGPTRIAVIFSDTKQWLPAHLVRVDGAADLAEIQLDGDGHYPIVSGLVQRTDTIPVGRSVAIMGYPLGTDTPMEGSGMHITARSSLSAGTVSKNLATVLQVDAYAGEGSSGSPVFDAKGHVIGVVYGAARESQGRLVYA